MCVVHTHAQKTDIHGLNAEFKLCISLTSGDADLRAKYIGESADIKHVDSGVTDSQMLFNATGMDSIAGMEEVQTESLIKS